VEHQFEVIGECLVNARDWRLRSRPAAASDVESDKMSAKGSASNASDEVCFVTDKYRCEPFLITQ